jgi:hypothetical protein
MTEIIITLSDFFKKIIYYMSDLKRCKSVKLILEIVCQEAKHRNVQENQLDMILNQISNLAY